MSSTNTTPATRGRFASITRSRSKNLQTAAQEGTPTRALNPKPEKKAPKKKDNAAKPKNKRKSPSPDPLDGDTDVDYEEESPKKKAKASPKKETEGKVTPKGKGKKTTAKRTPAKSTPSPAAAPPAAAPSLPTTEATPAPFDLSAEVEKAIHSAVRPYLCIAKPLMDFQLVCAKLNGRDGEAAAIHQAEVLSLINELKAKQGEGEAEEDEVEEAEVEEAEVEEVQTDEDALDLELFGKVEV
ncbi:hypothetical protein OPT61_g9360 [Boeremia exigua]|uniref:Uncharacterized protein n=1 Tax=Boeremia exigua TaxID=749465 RepID=A0ACC2HW23_9PLEO|nr:hypothetical protein OPT61_g9360 [Boeremia exigua]